MEITNITIIGLLAAALTTFGFFPQLIKIIRTKRTEDISLYMYIILICGVILWEIYGIIIEDIPIIVANIVTLILTVSILILKIVYQRRENEVK